jgi:hypothetical protein
MGSAVAVPKEWRPSSSQRHTRVRGGRAISSPDSTGSSACWLPTFKEARVAALGHRGGVGEVRDVSPAVCSRQVAASLHLRRWCFAVEEDARAAAPSVQWLIGPSTVARSACLAESTTE